MNLTSKQQEINFIKNNRLVILFFKKPTCPSCIRITPIFESLIPKYPKIKFGIIDASQIKCDNLITVPTFVGYVDGKAVAVHRSGDPNTLSRMFDDIK